MFGDVAFAPSGYLAASFQVTPPSVLVAWPMRQTVAVYGEYVGQVESPQTVELRARVEQAGVRVRAPCTFTTHR